ncbi:MAG: hypothetical protein L0Y72_16420 [Gemmataceae bacterium]|nr:hypothetical protein [Gemmataceae bacterium]MCI0740634.1 hypothetical protein [Gemmataceae bacterium]
MFTRAQGKLWVILVFAAVLLALWTSSTPAQLRGVPNKPVFAPNPLPNAPKPTDPTKIGGGVEFPKIIGGYLGNTGNLGGFPTNQFPNGQFPNGQFPNNPFPNNNPWNNPWQNNPNPFNNPWNNQANNPWARFNPALNNPWNSPANNPYMNPYANPFANPYTSPWNNPFAPPQNYNMPYPFGAGYPFPQWTGLPMPFMFGNPWLWGNGFANYAPVVGQSFLGGSGTPWGGTSGNQYNTLPFPLLPGSR